jgi:alanyl-tRNA synthetase
MENFYSGANVRQSFIDFFISKGHTFVPSSSLVPGGDQTLLFTNAGMVQFKDVFLGTDRRPYTRAVNSQKCMRVAGKHNDLEDVGSDTYHHTFFEMLGNWSFGDYYKKEAIDWAWELLTKVWKLPSEKLWATCFKDDKGDIPSDEEAAQNWRLQPGMMPEHVLFFGRKDNFWEMAEVGPCGPCSEIHLDRGEEYCDRKDQPGHVCGVNRDCARFLELWNLVFIQYNRLDQTHLEPLPARHVDTGMGLDRIVSVLQGVSSNYATDLLSPLMDTVQEIAGQTNEEREANITPYRVISDHARAATFLIADGVVPGNTGRNYVCRMIIRRAARFGGKIGLDKPFLARIAEVVIANYGGAYPELRRHQDVILDNLTREEERFRRTIESGLSRLLELMDGLKANGEKVLPGQQAFDLYATLGLPFEITRDIARENGLDVDEKGFWSAMEDHRVASGAGKTFGTMEAEDVEIYRSILLDLVNQGLLTEQGVEYDPYSSLQVEGDILAIVKDGNQAGVAQTGEDVEIMLPSTCFYIESGGQVADTGKIISREVAFWEIKVTDVRRPAAGVIVHIGKVTRGQPAVGDKAIAEVDRQRRIDIMRNHTATHLLHAVLHQVLGSHALQAGSLVAPDRFRFDFNHPSAISGQELEKIETRVNQAILENYPVKKSVKLLQEAIDDGATALFGEKYGENVRTITIGGPHPFSYELCGGTHVDETGSIGLFLITSEGSAAAGVRRIEAVTGREAYSLVQHRLSSYRRAASILETSLEEVPDKAQNVLHELEGTRKNLAHIRQEMVSLEFEKKLSKVPEIAGIPVLATILQGADAETLRQMADRFRQVHPSGGAVLASVVDGRPVIIVALTDDLVKKGFHAGELAKSIAQLVGGSGGGRPALAQAGGKDATHLSEALDQVIPYFKNKLN